MSVQTLFVPIRLGALQLPHRVIMAPLTRMRAGAGGVPNALNAEYYKQRASVAMIITEGTAISQQGQGYPGAPGAFTAEQLEGWRGITDAIHGGGGRIVIQLAHNGRNSHSSYMPDGSVPVAPSAIPPSGKAFTPDFQQVDYQIPRALETAEIPGIVDSFRLAARKAMEVGFDGVEVQGANGHLLDQFLQDGTNKRTDMYGGSIANRSRFLLEVVDAIRKEIGADRLGVRLAPHNSFAGISDSNPIELFGFVIRKLSERQIAYLHLIEARASEIGLSEGVNVEAVNNARLFRHVFDGPLISAGAHTPESASTAIEEGHADAIAFGRMFLANPDFIERIRKHAGLNIADRATFYGGAAHGYTDYPVLS
jgi:N-ethylmaleimide reductase